VYSTDLPINKPSSTASTLWSLTLVPSDDWKRLRRRDERIAEGFEEDEQEF
jgi:hypothetical protein